jgi:hypothetical protein
MNIHGNKLNTEKKILLKEWYYIFELVYIDNMEGASP